MAKTSFLAEVTFKHEPQTRQLHAKRYYLKTDFERTKLIYHAFPANSLFPQLFFSKLFYTKSKN